MPTNDHREAGPRIRSFPRADDGFTLVEVLVTILVLSIGLLSTMALLDNGNRSTASTISRDAGNNVAREVLERAQRVTFDSLTRTGANGISGVLGATNGDPGTTSSTNATTGARTITRRGVTYTVTASACAIDDPSNGVGVIAGTAIVRQFCDAVTTTNPTTPTGNDLSGPTYQSGTCTVTRVDNGISSVTGSAVAVQLGITSAIGVGGCLPSNIAGALCGIVGPGITANATLNQLVGLAANGGLADTALKTLTGGGANVVACGGSGTPIAIDPNPLDPDDATRVTTTVSWVPAGSSDQRRSTVTQSAIVANPGTGGAS